MIVPVGNQQYFVRLAGAGEPVVLLHGFTGTAKQWENLVNQSDIFCQWIGIDMPGHGKTLIRDEKTMEGYVDELIEVINQLELNRFHLVGYSMGGRTAMLLADRYPNRVKSLTLVGALPGLESEEERAERKKKDEELATFIEEKGIERFVDYWENIPLFQTQKSLPNDIQKAIRKERLIQTEHGLALSLQTMGTGVMPSLWDRLEQLNLPTCLITGKLDEKFTAINQKMVERLPQAELNIVEEAGHAVHVENLHSFVKIVSEFLQIHMKHKTHT